MMNYRICLLFMLLIFACQSKNQQSKPSVNELASADSTVVAINEEDDSWHKIDSIGEIKALIFKQFQKHREDSAYARLAMFADKEETIYQAEIRVGNLFHPSLKSAVLGWSVTDSTMDVEVFHFQNGDWKSVFNAKNIPAEKSGIALRSEFLFFSDYNHDGWKDLEVMVRSWDGIGVGHQSRLWLVSKQGFTPVRNFEKIDSPEPDSTENLVYSYLSGGCMDMAMHFGVWKLQKNSIHLVKRIELDCCVGIGPNCAVSVNGGKPVAVPSDKVHLYVPKHHRAWIKEKMQH